MERKYLFLIIGVLVVVVAIGSYYEYQNYRISQIQSFLKESAQHTNIAATYANQTVSTALKKDYNGAISLAQKTQEELNNSIELDNQALQYADGPYKEYIVYDIMKMNKNYAMEDSNIRLYQAEQKNDVNGEYYANIEIKQNENDAYDYKNKRNEIVVADPSLFGFLSN